VLEVVTMECAGRSHDKTSLNAGEKVDGWPQFRSADAGQ
jgi:hypothetical protein